MYCRQLTCMSLVLLAGMATGCSFQPEAPERFSVMGTVMFKGTLVPAGLIRFSPDTAKGNYGPGAIAEIKEGRFVTTPGKGAISGPMVVYVEGFDGISLSKNPDFPDLGKMLFRTHKEEIVIPKEDTEIVIEVPG